MTVIDTHDRCPGVARRHSCGCRTCDIGIGWLSLECDLCDHHADFTADPPAWGFEP